MVPYSLNPQNLLPKTWNCSFAKPRNTASVMPNSTRTHTPYPPPTLLHHFHDSIPKSDRTTNPESKLTYTHDPSLTRSMTNILTPTEKCTLHREPPNHCNARLGRIRKASRSIVDTSTAWNCMSFKLKCDLCLSIQVCTKC